MDSRGNVMKIRCLIILCVVVMLVGCAAGAPYITPMRFSAPQQEIVDIVAIMGQEILVFDYSVGNAFNYMAVRGEVLRYGESLGSMGGLFVRINDGLGDGRLAVFISYDRHSNEFRYIISAEGGVSTGYTWTHDSEIVGRMFRQINEAVQITDGQEIIIYISKFTTGHSMSAFYDFQYYLQHPEALAGYTYVHLVKVRFSQEGWD